MTAQQDVFQGLKVLDFSWVAAGPLTTKFLGDHGATVVRLESGNHPDVLRPAMPYRGTASDLNGSGYFGVLNTNKHSVNLNLNAPHGLALAKRLVAWADVVVENYTVGTLERWGLGYEQLKAIRPDIVLVRVSLWGQTGPYRQLSGFGVHLAGTAGFVHYTGWPDRPPVQPFGAYTDLIAPLFGAATLIAALDYRRRTGKGLCVDLSQLEAALQFLPGPLLDYTANGVAGGRMGNASPDACPHAVYRCQGEERWLAVEVNTQEEWAAFCWVLDHPEWRADPRFAMLADRKEHEQELDALVGQWTATVTPEEAMARLQAAGVAAGVVMNSRDVLADPHLKERGYFWMLDHKVMGQFPHFGEVPRLALTPAVPKLPSPCLGAATEFVCKQIAGLSDEEYAAVVRETE